ncbi:MAG: ATP-binding protein [Candidatus Omnitrophota bacterium]
MKIRNKLILSFAGIAILVGVLGYVLLIQLNTIYQPLTIEIPKSIEQVRDTSHLDNLAQFIRYYNEILTQSARNYAFTQNEAWKKRYKDIEPKLNEILKKAIGLGDEEDKEFFLSVDDANMALVEMEYNSIELVDNEKPEKAVEILESEAYWDQKKIYEQGLKNYVKRRGVRYDEALLTSTRTIDLIIKNTRNLIRTSTQITVLFAIAALILAAGAGLFVVYSIIRSISDLCKIAEEIGKGNLDIKKKITTKDEIGLVSGALYKMADDLKKTTTSVTNLNKEITERKKAEEKVKGTYAQLDQIFQSTGDGLVVITKDLKLVRANDAFLSMIGSTEKDIKDRECHDLFPGDLCEISRGVVERILGGEERIERDVMVARKDGIKIPCILTATPFYGADGNIEGIIEALKDITERKSAEESLLESIRLKSNFASVVSHELRTPLTAIKEGISIVLDGSAGKINKDQGDFLETAKKNVDRLARLINDVLDFSKIKAGKMRYRMLGNDIREVIKEVVKSQERIAKDKALYLKTKFSPDIPKVNFDRDRIIQVITNLINNALKYTDKGGVTVVADTKGENICISVNDTGPGIKKEDMPYLFQEFRQLEEERKRKTGGTGLGLSISKEIIEKHGGKVWAESEHGKGSQFKFTIPIERKYKILVVDDDEVFLDFCDKLLRKNEYEVLRAMTGADGIEKIRSEHPDLVVLDMRLPDVNGYEVIGRLRSEKDISNIPVLAVSGYTEELEKIEKIETPDDRLEIPKLMKPLDNKEFLLTIEAVLRSRA